MLLLTPRARAWLDKFSQPDDQIGRIALALTDQAYISSEVITKESPEKLQELQAIKELKPGAKLTFKKKLINLKVCMSVAGQLGAFHSFESK
jgi:hypothetical protein